MEDIKKSLAKIAPYVICYCLGIATYKMAMYPNECLKIILAVVERF